MGIDYRIDDDVIIVTIHGVVFYEDVAEVFDKVASDSAFRKPARILFDGRFSEYGPPLTDIHALADRLGSSRAFGGSCWAMVAAPDSLMYGLGRMFGSFLEIRGLRGEHFTDLDKARKWLRRCRRATSPIKSQPL